VLRLGRVAPARFWASSAAMRHCSFRQRFIRLRSARHLVFSRAAIEQGGEQFLSGSKAG
jgi:hypothetical protein